MDLMRTNIVLDDDLVAEASRLSGIKTKEASSMKRCGC